MPRDEQPMVRLTAEQRSKLVPDIDVSALERFLQYVATTDKEREALIWAFTQQRNQSFQIVGAATGGTPAIQALLDEIWAPTWLAAGRDAIENSDSRLPGRELARARLGPADGPKE